METSTIREQQISRYGKALFPVFSGVFFGFNLALIAGDTILRINTDPTNTFLSNSLLLGAITGCLLVLFAGNFKTRREILLIGIFISLITSLFGGIIFVSDISSSNYLLYTIRFFMGITAGLSCVAPAFLVEECPRPHDRGNYFAWYQLSITIGIFFAYLLIAIFKFFEKDVPSSIYYSTVFFLAAFFSVVYLFILFFLKSPEFAKWEKKHDKVSTEKKNIRKWLDTIERNHKITEKENKNKEKAKHTLLTEPEIIKKTPWYKVYITPIIIGVLIIAIQQFVGINIIIFKMPELLSMFDVTNEGMVFILVITGLINVLSTIPGMLMIDRIGRKALFLMGMVGIIGSLILLTFLVSNIKPNYDILPNEFSYFNGEFCIENNSIVITNNCDKCLVIVDDAYSKEKFKKVEDFDGFKKNILSSVTGFHLITANPVDQKDSLRVNSSSINQRFISVDNGVVIQDDGANYNQKFKFVKGTKHINLYVFMFLSILYVISFASTLGIIGWLVPAEVLPIKIRSRGMAVVAITHWVINFIIISTFNIAYVSTFYVVFLILSIFSFVLGIYYFPETNQKPLKKIDYFWRNGGSLDDFNNDKLFEEKSIETEIEIEKHLMEIHKFAESISKNEENKKNNSNS